MDNLLHQSEVDELLRALIEEKQTIKAEDECQKYDVFPNNKFMSLSLQESLKVARCTLRARIPVLLYAEIKEYAAKTRLSQSEILCKALKYFFENEEIKSFM